MFIGGLLAGSLYVSPTNIRSDRLERQCPQATMSAGFSHKASMRTPVALDESVFERVRFGGGKVAERFAVETLSEPASSPTVKLSAAFPVLKAGRGARRLRHAADKQARASDVTSEYCR